MTADMAKIAAKIEAMVKDAVSYQERMSKDRITATDYYHGKMDDMPPRPNWSKAVSRDLRAVMAKAMPSIMRTILGSDKVVEYQPVGQGDEESAAQATDYVNAIVIGESGATEAIYDACFDALLLRNGVLTWRNDERVKVTGSKHSGLGEAELGALVAGDDVEVLSQDVTEGEAGPVYAVEIKRTLRERKTVLLSVPMDEFLISSNALCIEDADLVGQMRKLTRSDLIAMGYSKSVVDELPAQEGHLFSDAERYSRRRYSVDDRRPEEKENERIDYFDLIVKIDVDGDGIAETRRMCLAGGFTERNILVNEYAEEANYADVVAERMPHQWEGVSLADDVIEIQRVKTALLRYAMDNIYWQNTRQPIVSEGLLTNPESVMQPEFGRPILLKPGVAARDAIAYNEVPFVAANILQVIAYWDGQTAERTGIDDASAGLPPDALQNVTAKASALLEQKGIARVEMLVRTLANGGLRKAFKGLLRLIVENQDRARTVRLRDKWVDIDPRAWNADMDATVSTGLGAGTRERDMMVMQAVMGAQEKLLAGFGPDNPFVKPDNVWAALSGFVQAAGLKTPSMYFTKPDEQEVAAALEAKRNAKPMEIQKIEAEAMAKAELFRAQIPMEIEKERIKVEAAKEKEIAQGQAAVEERKAIAQIEATAKAEELLLKRYEIDQKVALEREKMDNELNRARAASFGRELTGLTEAAGKPVANAGLELLEVLKAIKSPPKQRPRKLRIVRDENGDMTGAEEIDESDTGAVAANEIKAATAYT